MQEDEEVTKVQQSVAQIRLLSNNILSILDDLDTRGDKLAVMPDKRLTPLFMEIENVLRARVNWTSENAIQAIKDTIQFQLSQGNALLRRATSPRRK